MALAPALGTGWKGPDSVPQAPQQNDGAPPSMESRVLKSAVGVLPYGRMGPPQHRPPNRRAQRSVPTSVSLALVTRLSSALAAQEWASFQPLSVFFMSIATVIGPTPPGTGVIFEQRGETLGKWTSPVRR